LYSLPQKLLAELFGTFGLVFIVAGAICADQYLRAAASARPGPLGVALAYGLAVALMGIAFGHVSGGHFNPAVTVASWVTRRIGTFMGLFYCLAQLAGAVAAALLLSAIVPEPVWRPVGLGAPDLTADFTRAHGMLMESVLTFFVVLVAFAATREDRDFSISVGGFAVGLTVTAASLVGSPFTGAGLNPARSFGPALVAHHWQNHGVYWIGPLFGAICAGLLYEQLFRRQRSQA